MICEDLTDYTQYGVWNGKPFIPSYNREERRKYIKENRHNKNASHCAYCNANTLTVSDDNGQFCCALCGRYKSIKVEVKAKDYTTHIQNDGRCSYE